MKRIFFVTIVLAVLIATGCKDNNETATLELKINPTFGDEPIDLYEEVIDENGLAIFELEKMYFFISDLKLGEELVKDEVLLVDIGDAEFNKAVTSIKPGSYNNINFGLGVEERWNNQDPSVHDIDHVLGAGHGDKQWNWETGYIFYKLEGKYSTYDDGELDGRFSFHMGRDDFYRTVSFDKTLNVVKDGTTEIELNIDLKQLFFENSDIDLKSKNKTHAAPSDFEFAEKFANRLIESIE